MFSQMFVKKSAIAWNTVDTVSLIPFQVLERNSAIASHTVIAMCSIPLQMPVKKSAIPWNMFVAVSLIHSQLSVSHSLTLSQFFHRRTIAAISAIIPAITQVIGFARSDALNKLLTVVTALHAVLSL